MSVNILTLDTGVLKSNYLKIKSIFGDKLICVVKANAYGHGLKPVVSSLVAVGARAFAVANVDEAIRVRSVCDRARAAAEIFVLGYVDRREFPAAEKFGVTVPVVSEAGFVEIMLSDRKLKCYLQVDTGMNRLGVDYRDRKRIRLMTRALTSAKNLRFFGLGTHVFDASDARAVNAQRNRLIRLECDLPLSVCASESLNFGGAGEYKRPGICLYGYGRTAERSRLLPPLSLTTRVVRIKPLEKGETVGYNAVFRAKKHTLVGTLPLGYADGMMRSYVGGSVFLKGEECRVLAVCMDMTMISLPRGAAVGDEVTVFSVERGLEDLTARAGTIVYEGLTALGSRLTRVIK